MPSKTPSQKRFMEAVSHDKAFADKVDVPQSVGKEFVDADKKKSRMDKLYSNKGKK